MKILTTPSRSPSRADLKLTLVVRLWAFLYSRWPPMLALEQHAYMIHHVTYSVR